MNDGITFIAAALLCRPSPAPTAAPAATNKTELMRSALRSAGLLGMDAFHLAAVAGLSNSGLVGALLKYDLHKGRVSFSGGRYYTARLELLG